MISALSLVFVQTTLSFSHPVASLRDFVPALSKALGVPLEVSRSEQWKSIYVKTKDVSANDLLEKVAEAVGSKWEVNSEGVRILKPDPARALRIKAARQAQTTKAINDYLTQADKSKDSESKVLAQVIRAVGVNALAAMPNGTRVVYSTHPTRMQRQAPSINSTLIQALIAEHNKQANKPREEDDQMDEFKKSFPPEMIKLIDLYNDFERPKAITTPVAKFNFVFTIDSYVQTALQGFDANGKMIISGNAGFYDEVMATEAMPEVISRETLPTKDKGQERDKEDTRVVKLSKEAAEFAKGLTDFSSRMPGKAKKSPTRDALLKIAESDPFLKFDQEVLDQVLAEEKRSIVLGLADSELFTADSLTFADVLTMHGIDLKQKGPWLTRKLGDDETNFDRDRLSAVLGRLSQPRLTLDDRAWLAAEYDAFDRNSMRPTYAITLFGGNLYGQNSELLKLYGTLSKGQKLSARSKGVAINQLSSEQRKLADSIVYGAHHSAAAGFGNSVNESDMFESMFDMESMFKKQMADLEGRSSYLGEPTEALPNGLPPDGFIVLSETLEDGYRPAGEGKGDANELFGMGDSISQTQLASVIAMKDLPMFVGEFGAQMPTSFEHIKRKRIELKLVCMPNYGAKEELFETTDDPAEKVDLKKMGPEFDGVLEKMKKGMKTFEKMMSFGGAFFNRRGNPPPVR